MVARQLMTTIICVLATISLTEGNNFTSQWTTWSLCNGFCFQGTRHRQRICASSDTNCTGLQNEPCNTQACLYNNTAFTDTACNATCNNTGWFKRTSYCLDPTTPLNGICAPNINNPCIGSCASTAGLTLTTQHANFITIPINQRSTTDLPSQYNPWIAIAVTGWALLFVVLLLILGFALYRRKKLKQVSDRNETTKQVAKSDVASNYHVNMSVEESNSVFVKVQMESPEYEEVSTTTNKQSIRNKRDPEQPMGSKSTYEVPMTNKQLVKLGIMSYSKDDYVEINK